MDKVYSLGVDIGSTTVKTVILDDGKIIWSKYQRHFSKVRETAAEQVEEIGKMFPDARFKLAITGSAGLGLANAASLPFVQEVHSAFISVKHDYPDADCVIELGGEDAKIIFLTGGTEQRMNGSCAGERVHSSTRWLPSLALPLTRWTSFPPTLKRYIL